MCICSGVLKESLVFRAGFSPPGAFSIVRVCARAYVLGMDVARMPGCVCGKEIRLSLAPLPPPQFHCRPVEPPRAPPTPFPSPRKLGVNRTAKLWASQDWKLLSVPRGRGGGFLGEGWRRDRFGDEVESHLGRGGAQMGARKRREGGKRTTGSRGRRLRSKLPARVRGGGRGWGAAGSLLAAERGSRTQLPGAASLGVF